MLKMYKLNKDTSSEGLYIRTGNGNVSVGKVYLRLGQGAGHNYYYTTYNDMKTEKETLKLIKEGLQLLNHVANF